jgi:hypothetical protein
MGTPAELWEGCVSKRILAILLAACLTTTAGLAKAAEAAFIGNWQLDPARTRLPDEMKVQSKGGDTYAFDFGGGVETIAVNGADQQGVDGTLLSVKAEAPDTWIVQRKQGDRLLVRATWKLSKDGRTLTDYFRQFDSAGAMLSMDYVYRRAGPGSAFVGVWQSVKETMKSPLSMQVKAFEGDGLSFVTSPKLIVKNVKLDGRDYPRDGASAHGGASSSARRVDERTLTVTDKSDGKVTVTEDFGLSADLKTLTMTQHIAGRDKPNVFVFKRA